MVVEEGEDSHGEDAVSREDRGVLSFLSRNFTMIVVLFAFVFLLVVLGVYFYSFDNGLSNKQEVWGQFGDFVGGVLNPLFGFTTIIILILTLNLQRKELKEVRDTAVINNLILKEQLKSVRHNSLENTFFKTLDELKKNPVLAKCVGADARIDVFAAVHSIYQHSDSDLNAKGFPTRSDYFFRFVGNGLQLGEFVYVVADQLVALSNMASKLENNHIHYSLIRSAVTPPILSTAIHMAFRENNSSYNSFVAAKGIFRGVNSNFVYFDEVAKGFCSENTIGKYERTKDSNFAGWIEFAKKREARLKLKENKGTSE